MGTKQYDSATDLITFSRASGGTALSKISYGNNSVTNGTFDTDLSGWTQNGAEWVYSNGKAALLANAIANQSLSSTNAYVKAGKTYRVRFDASTSVGTPVNTYMKVRIKSNDNGTGVMIYNQNYILTGSTEIFLSPTANGYVSFDNVVSSSFDKFIDNVSIEEVLFGQSDGTLQVFNHGNNIPRIEYDATGAVKGLLIEEARTNIAKYSEDFTQGYWKAYNAVTTTGNVAVAPDGNLTADRIAAKNATTNNGAFTDDDVPTGGCVSVFAKADTVDWLGFGQAGGCWAYFDLANGVTGNKSTTVGYTSITAYPNGWYLCQAWGITISWHRVLFSPKPTEGNGDPWSNVTNAIGDSVFLWGAQMEAGAFPTSYIPTTGATATRAMDLAEIPTSAFGYNNDKGSIAVEFKSNKPSSLDYGAFGLSDGTPYNRIIHFTSATAHRAGSINSGNLDVDIGAGSRGAPSELVKFAIGFSDNNFAASLNGATAVTDTSVTIPSGLSKLALGYFYDNFQANFAAVNGHIKSIQYYPRQLTNTQLQELTT
jgi:hypothetical protein